MTDVSYVRKNGTGLNVVFVLAGRALDLANHHDNQKKNPRKYRVAICPSSFVKNRNINPKTEY